MLAIHFTFLGKSSNHPYSLNIGLNTKREQEDAEKEVKKAVGNLRKKASYDFSDAISPMNRASLQKMFGDITQIVKDGSTISSFAVKTTTTYTQG